MNPSLALLICVAVCGCFEEAAAQNSSEPADPTPTPAPGAPGAPDGAATTEGFPPTTDGGSQVTSSTSSTIEPSTVDAGTSTVDPDNSTGTTEGPPATTAQSVVQQGACPCNLTPDFCDIGCCCDTFDCDVANLSTVFTGCPQKAVSGYCIEKWLVYRANVDSSLVTVTDSLFCVRPAADTKAQPAPALPRLPALGDSYHFAPPEPPIVSHRRGFYRVDDVIQTFFSNSSVRGLLRQPSPGAAAALCVNRNPAKFLRSGFLSCARALTPQTCATDPSLNARSYFSDLSLLKIPRAGTEQVSDFLIPVTPVSDWPAPTLQNDLCVNATKKVEFVIGYTGRGELTYATVNVVLADVDPTQPLLQTHSVQFQLATPRATPGGQNPASGLKVGSSVYGRFNATVQPLTTMGALPGGGCSSDPGTRAHILFTHNTITGCAFSSPSSSCSELRLQIYRLLQQGDAAPDAVAMSSGSQPAWTRVIAQGCGSGEQETCESGCTLPHSLTVQVLWARQGALDLPQSYILGVKYLFQCRKFKCPLSSPLTLTTEVVFADSTLYPEPPRGLPQPDWKFPFGFFTRGAAELDGHVINGSDTEKVTGSLMLFTVMLLTGLEFFAW